MRLGVSNLLWTRDDDEAVARLLTHRGIDAIDIAPTRYFEDVGAASTVELREIRRFWASRGIAITGMQSLLYGACGLSIFGDLSTRQRTRAHLCRVLEIGADLGATQMVFGSWRNRNRGSLSPAVALGRAADFFRDIAVVAQRLGVRVAIEPVSGRYGNNFLTNHDEVAELVEAIGSDAVSLTLDIGCISLEEEDLGTIVMRHERLISHVQLAEYQLAPLDPQNPVHAFAGPLVTAALPGRVACIEALKPPDMSSLVAIAQSLDVAQQHYG